MGYKVPVLKTAPESWEPYALEVLTGILDGGESARLATNLIRGSQVAASASAGYDMSSRMEDLLLLSGTPSKGHHITELENAFRQQIQQLRETPVNAAELARIKAQVVASNIYQRDSVFYQAMQIGTLESVGLDWRLLDEYVDRIRKITAAQVQAVARKYLIEDQLTIGTLKPLPIKDGKARHPVASGGHFVR